jgi:hypothetical protein
LGLDNLHFVYGKNYRNSLGDYFITSLLFWWFWFSGSA